MSIQDMRDWMKKANERRNCGAEQELRDHLGVIEGLRLELSAKDEELTRLRAELSRADVALSEAPFHGQEELSEASLADGIRNYRNAVETELSRLRAALTDCRNEFRVRAAGSSPITHRSNFEMLELCDKALKEGM